MPQLLRSVVARLRLALARHPSIHWAIVAVLATSVGVGVHRQLDGAARARAGWGDGVDVVVAVADHAVGDPLRVELRTLPAAAVPGAALSSIGPGARAVQAIGTGEIVVAGDVTDRSGPGALAAPGAAVVAVADPLVPEPPVGAAVTIVADGVVLADGGRVVDRRDEVAFVELDAGDAPSVAAAARQGIASIVFRGADPP